MSFTNYQELIKMSDDIEYMASKLTLPHVNGTIPFILNQTQKNILKELDESDSKINNIYASRQIGISSLSALMFTHDAVFNSGKRIGVLSKRLIGNEYPRDLFNRWFQELSTMGVTTGLNIEVNNKGCIELSNGTKIKFANIDSSSLRGCTYSRLYIDNIETLDDKDIDNFMYSVLPTINSGKQGKATFFNSGHFQNNKIDTYQGINTYKFPWYTVSDPNYLVNVARTRSMLPKEKFECEYGD